MTNNLKKVLMVPRFTFYRWEKEIFVHKVRWALQIYQSKAKQGSIENVVNKTFSIVFYKQSRYTCTKFFLHCHQFFKSLKPEKTNQVPFFFCHSHSRTISSLIFLRRSECLILSLSCCSFCRGVILSKQGHPWWKQPSVSKKLCKSYLDTLIRLSHHHTRSIHQVNNRR